MKKIITLLAVVGMFSLQGCTTTTDPNFVDKDTISEVFEVTTSFNAANNYSKVVALNPPIFTSDVILVYRLAGIYQGKDVWKLLPETRFFSDGTMDFGYDFDFTVNDVNIFMVGNDLLTVTNDFRLNQVLRIVIVPARFANTLKSTNYFSVISALKINENQIQKINL